MRALCQTIRDQAMAQLDNRLPQNVEGDFYVDASCIDCDACRQIAPETFRDHGDQSSVGRQPSTPEEIQRALMAIVACPTASIGTVSHRNAREAALAFPSNVYDNVFFCGFTSEASFGAWAYLIVRPPEEGGNILVDSPRFSAPLVKRIEEMGGVALMFLSHRDDIADHAKYAAHFRCPRVMHQSDGARSARYRTRDEWGRAGSPWRRLDLDSDARSHARSSGAVVSRAGALYRRPPRVVTRARYPHRLSRRLLVFMARSNTVDGAAAGLSLRMGAAGTWSHPPRPGRRDAPSSRTLCRVDEEPCDLKYAPTSAYGNLWGVNVPGAVIVARPAGPSRRQKWRSEK